MHFDSLQDVEQYFSSRRELAQLPVPPADLWEQLDRVRQSVDRHNQKASRVLPSCPPETLKITHTAPTRRQKKYVLKAVQRIQAALPARGSTAKTRFSCRVPMSWDDLL